MNPSSIDTLKNNFFEIQNVNSSFNQYYHLTSPYNAVIETYRSDLDQPYFKISSFSPEHTSHSLIDATELLEKMKNRPLHQHDFFEIMFVLQGEAVVKIENTKRVYPSGTGCIVNCNLRHVELLSHDFRIFFLNLSKDYLLSYFSRTICFIWCLRQIWIIGCLSLLYNNAMDADNVKKRILEFFLPLHNPEGFQKLYQIAEEIIKITLSPQIGSSFFINGLICRFLDTLSDPSLFHLANIQVDYGNDFLIFTSLTHLLENSDGRLSRHELSDLLSYSGDYLNRIAKKYTGMTLFEYGTTFSIRKAEYYLLKTDLSISEIIAQLKFTNKSHFYKLFYAKHHMSPKEFRSKYRKD